MEEENAEWIAGGDQHVNAHVTFEAVNEEGFVQVFLDDDVVSRGNLLRITVQLDTVDIDVIPH